ncbi:MAG: hypothetical protein IKC65_05695, partial [Lentisphaeria bacterium]|nr:hypothetical protein [Lentisphaeria bacterium]
SPRAPLFFQKKRGILAGGTCRTRPYMSVPVHTCPYAGAALQKLLTAAVIQNTEAISGIYHQISAVPVESNPVLTHFHLTFFLKLPCATSAEKLYSYNQCSGGANFSAAAA